MQIDNYREQSKTGPLIAYFDILTQNFILRDWRLRKSTKGHYYVQSPCVKQRDDFGAEKWLPAVEPRIAEKRKEFSNQIMELLKPFVYDL